MKLTEALEVVLDLARGNIIDHREHLAENRRQQVACDMVAECSGGTITITMEGGLIQEIEGIPPGVQVVVNDFDTELDQDDSRLTEINGQMAYQTIWEGDGFPSSK